MKRESRIKIALLLMSLLIGFYFLAKMDFRRSFALEEAAINEEEYGEIMSTRQPYQEDFSIDLILNEYTLPYDEETDTFLYSLPEGESEASNPTMQTHSTDYTGYDVALLEKEINQEALRKSEPIELLVYNDDYYKEYSIAFTTLPIVTIDLEEPPTEGEYPIEKRDKWAQFGLFDNRENVPATERHVKSYTYVRLRGDSSLYYPQKQMRLNLRETSIGGEETNNHLSLLGMREDDDWILQAPYSDPEKMRNVFSINMWHELSENTLSHDPNTGTEGRFVEVFIGDRYWGIYSMLFPIDDKQLKIDDNKKEPLEGDFYYRINRNEPPERELFQQSGNSLVAGSVELRYPDEPLDDIRQWAPLIEHLAAMEGEKEQVEEYLYSRVNLVNQIDYFLFYTFAQAYDNDTKNRNYVAYWQGDAHHFLESPWDLDLTWGSRWTPEHDLSVSVRGLPNENPILYPSLITRALEYGMEDVVKEVVDRYTELRETMWTEEALLAQLEEYEQEVFGSGASERHHTRWPEAAYAEDASVLKHHVKDRLVHMDQFVYEELQGGGLYRGNN